jgi:hypothetical protein
MENEQIQSMRRKGNGADRRQVEGGCKNEEQMRGDERMRYDAWTGQHYKGFALLLKSNSTNETA